MGKISAMKRRGVCDDVKLVSLHQSFRSARRFPIAEHGSDRYASDSTPSLPHAMLKAVVKTIALLAILFVMLYVGMNNGHTIDFHFPVAGTTDKAPIHAPAALVFFAVFAIGLLAGTILNVGGAGSGGGGKKSGGSKDK
jgi:uncharacterized membrane protein YciS (DUF1049 family)